MKKLTDMLKEKRIGFKMYEVMSGEHNFVDDSYGDDTQEYLPLPLEFRGSWGPENVLDWLNPHSENFMKQPFEGTITVGGLCENNPFKGSLKLDYFGENKIIYDLGFSVEGTEYQYKGEKRDVKLWEPHKLLVTHATCYGEVRRKEDNLLVSESITFFDWKTIFSFLASFRLE